MTEIDHTESDNDYHRADASCSDTMPQFCTSANGTPLQAACCTSIEFMNRTCAKTCKFCSEISVIPGNPIMGMPSVPGAGAAGGSPTVVTQQNPCEVPTPGSNTPTAGMNPTG